MRIVWIFGFFAIAVVYLVICVAYLIGERKREGQ